MKVNCMACTQSGAVADLQHGLCSHHPITLRLLCRVSSRRHEIYPDVTLPQSLRLIELSQIPDLDERAMPHMPRQCRWPATSPGSGPGGAIRVDRISI